ncbi:hypothetical protein WAI453_007643 [Rhynchosporium graminicola]|uniref:Dehydrogenases with different specificities (Related to short-chain alcohol dehydrogenases) n=1 Tax=Rhynchosporium graminicola TaxID=2792576 RepID=A0A1E1L2X0_9HELO|nr:uncharacterized protein RCO7_09233 [Rhynchosporium commune]
MASQAPSPSSIWTLWQFFQGIHNGNLSLPVADLRGKWIIVTGGNSGIGREAALQFAKWGANIILGCRPNPPPREPAPDAVIQELKMAAQSSGHENTTFESWECDMSDLASVEAFGRRWLATDRPLDILCNNAGMGGGNDGKPVITIDGFEIVHQVNFICHVLLTLVLLPSLARASEPRIICTTSNMQYIGTFDLTNANNGSASYPNNKLYFQAWLTELQERMSKNDNFDHIVIHGVHPGYTITNIWASNGLDMFSRFAGWLMHYVGIDSQQGSLAIINAATNPEWSLQRSGGGGTFANRIWMAKPMPQTKDPGCRRQVWDFVGEELKLKSKGLLEGLE